MRGHAGRRSTSWAESLSNEKEIVEECGVLPYRRIHGFRSNDGMSLCGYKHDPCAYSITGIATCCVYAYQTYRRFASRVADLSLGLTPIGKEVALEPIRRIILP